MGRTEPSVQSHKQLRDSFKGPWYLRQQQAQQEERGRAGNKQGVPAGSGGGAVSTFLKESDFLRPMKAEESLQKDDEPRGS